MSPPEIPAFEVNQAFNKKARNVAVAFKIAGTRKRDRNHDHQSNSQSLLHLSYIAIRYERPPSFTVRFTVRVHRKTGEVASLYFDIPRQNIVALIPTYHVDYATIQALDQDKKLKSMGDITGIRFQLNLPGNLVQPNSTEFYLKTASKSTLAAMTLLATVSEFDLFMPHKILSNKQINCLQQALNVPMTADDQLDQEKQTKIWLASLYAGKGGRLLDSHTADISPATIASGNVSGDTSPATSIFSDSDDSLIPLNFPPAYTSLSVPGDGSPTIANANHSSIPSDLDDKTPTASPPPYKSLKLKGVDCHLIAENFV
ncbi:hypothetical protein N7495_003655 [Penicillium taxi]|uniref:uncharacterized protein n=1 Tax=Penicillium taxi TaxID=168475 RepID=UPI002545AE73|nr:uncharacterized protein N7495_003655 [Penicillium taxi]KAJ5898911.1 hypothetical protein N7495_003655 [Penicillium taxi]